MTTKIRRGAMLIAQRSSVEAVGKDESEASVWDRAEDIRIGIRGIEMAMSTEEGRAFAGLIIEAVRRAEQRKRNAAKSAPSTSEQPHAWGKAEARSRMLLDVLMATRALVAEGADSGISDHGWMERLFRNQAVLSDAIAKASRSGGEPA